MRDTMEGEDVPQDASGKRQKNLAALDMLIAAWLSVPSIVKLSLAHLAQALSK